MKKLSVYQVDWMDSASRGKWGGYDEYREEEPLKVSSVGYLIKRNRTCVLLVQTFNETGGLSDSIVIPRGCIQSIVKLTREV